MGKHDIGTPINESLERHYKETIDTLKLKLVEAANALEAERLENERLRFRIKLKDVEIESLVKALAEE